MPRSVNTKTHSIFLLDKSKVQEKYFDGQDAAIDTMINRIIDEFTTQYDEQELLANANTGSFCTRLFFHGEENYESKLASFCRSFVKADQDIITFRPKTASSVLFIWSAAHIFAVTTGQGFRVVDGLCVPKFGMLVISTFQQLFRITALDSNGMSSIVHSRKTIYANEIDLIDVDTLDTVFKEVTGRLNDPSKVRELLQLDQQSKKKSMKIIARDYVQFSSSMNFNGLLHVLSQIDQYDYSALQDSFNLITPIIPKSNSRTVKENNHAVILKMYTAITSDAPLGFDLFNRSTNDFVGADNYSLVDGTVQLVCCEDIDPAAFITDAYTVYLGETNSSLETFRAFINSANLIAKKDDIVVTDGKLLKHISGEIEVNGKNYYIFYGDYYYLSETYSQRLNRSLNGKLQNSRFTNTLTTPWNDNDKEDDFNENASNGEGYVHLHEVKPELVEFADLLKLDGDVVKVVHVKNGFNADMRTLDRQVELSMTRVLDLKYNNSDTFMRKLYQKAKKCTKGRNITADFPDEGDFVKAMKEKEMQYIIAIRPPKKELMENRSNIAKHCLNALILRCFNQGFDLKINIL